MADLRLTIPDFADMSDDDIESHLLARGFDGRWSAQTRWLLKSFKTDLLELNEAWAMTSTVWFCPCCNRGKPEIARLTDQGVLLCQLDIHHDHLADLAGDTLRKALAGRISDDLMRARLRACSAALPLIERFAKVLVCNDCNAADGAMKAALAGQVHPHFSFSPTEISSFITVLPNTTHDIDIAQGTEVWLRASAQFGERLEFAELLGKRISDGLHDRETHGLSNAEPHHDDARLLFKLAWEQGGPRQRPSGIGEALLARSRSTAGRLSSAKRRTPARIRVPSAQDFLTIEQERRMSPPWRKAGSDWKCAVCSRTKFEITRVSNKGTWIAQIMALSDYTEETDPDSLWRRSARHEMPFFLGQRRQVLVCQDCRQVVTNAVTLLPGQSEHCLRLTDIRDLVGDAQPHRSHDIDRAEIARVAQANAEWIIAVEDFHAHCEEVHDASFQLERLRHNTGLPAELARLQLTGELVRAGKIPPVDSAGWLSWLLSESERLSKT